MSNLISENRFLEYEKFLSDYRELMLRKDNLKNHIKNDLEYNTPIIAEWRKPRLIEAENNFYAKTTQFLEIEQWLKSLSELALKDNHIKILIILYELITTQIPSSEWAKAFKRISAIKAAITTKKKKDINSELGLF